MIDTLVEFYYYFLHERHYFECHEIMEDAWKENSVYTKNDIEVGLILLATSQYHLRRGNKKGARTCLKKAYQILKMYSLSEIGLHDSVLYILEENMTSEEYVPLTLPLTNEMKEAIHKQHPDFSVKHAPDARWIHFHRTRDRSDVIEARLKSMRDKHPVDDTPDKRHD
ncbi:DUF309 domain-containing protein [Macrococcus brunensis]|uniref:DUF309 domain-containing protein n=1 Tax=Macrococcus brunensis TaxID=198483 RepID=A0A4R6BDM2_9STAP|nr:DUF309 domain-containing protein [Macrococcus brunensis]TDL97842.1 DUF309 domain-containing protein [Macrococcus brunensis]